MTVYLDVLITVNLIVNYFLLLLTSKFANIHYKNFKLLFSALIGSLFSPYILLQNTGIFLDCIVKLLTSFLMILLGFDIKNIKNFVRNTVILFFVSFLYCGFMMALWMTFKWNTIIINNSVVYLNISPVFLIGFSVIFYLIIVIFKSLLKKNSLKAKRCIVKLFFNKKIIEAVGIFDTGNSVKDIFSNREVIFISKNNGLKFLGAEPENFKNCYRLLPCSTVTGSKLLEAVRLDKAEVFIDNNLITLSKPILAISETMLDEEYSVILNPEILMYTEERNVQV